jgi:O-succinylbenzoic acid--CoA ligase
VNAVDVLPAYHVSGLMARVRCAATGGRHVPWDWKRLEAGNTPELPGEVNCVISLVPTQLHRLLGSPRVVKWLRSFKVIFVGGGPIWPTLADAAARADLPLSLSYGMTETAAMVTALRPEEFLAGARSSGRALPHAKATVTTEGVVRIEGESVFRGYFPGFSEERVYETEDLGRVDAQGHWHIMGRRDALIITGGKKVNPLEVEEVLRGTEEFADVAVLGVPDAEWGEAVMGCYPTGCNPNLQRVELLLRNQLPGHARPKRFIALDDWPRNAQGKLNRPALLAAVAEALIRP